MKYHSKLTITNLFTLKRKPSKTGTNNKCLPQSPSESNPKSSSGEENNMPLGKLPLPITQVPCEGALEENSKERECLQKNLSYSFYGSHIQKESRDHISLAESSLPLPSISNGTMSTSIPSSTMQQMSRYDLVADNEFGRGGVERATSTIEELMPNSTIADVDELKQDRLLEENGHLEGLFERKMGTPPRAKLTSFKDFEGLTAGLCDMLRAATESRQRPVSNRNLSEKFKFGMDEEDVRSVPVRLGRPLNPGGDGEAPQRLQSDILNYKKEQVCQSPSMEKDYSAPSKSFSLSPSVTSGLHSLDNFRTFQKTANGSSSNVSRSHVEKEIGEVANEIQDDLRRVEMLIELRVREKYKQALKTQLQAQQRLLNLCSNENLEESQPNPPSPTSNKARLNDIQGFVDQVQDEKNNSAGNVFSYNRDGDSDKSWKNDWVHLLANMQPVQPNLAQMKPKTPPRNPVPVGVPINQNQWNVPSRYEVQERIGQSQSCPVSPHILNQQPPHQQRQLQQQLWEPPKQYDRPFPFFSGQPANSEIEMPTLEKIRKDFPHPYQLKRLKKDTSGGLKDLNQLLSQIPDLGGKQNVVEELAYRNLLLPSPAKQENTQAPIMPQLSSNVTGLTTSEVYEDKNPVQEDLNGNMKKAGAAEGDNMSIGELVTLGRKIYQILGKLNKTGSEEFQKDTSKTFIDKKSLSTTGPLPLGSAKRNSKSATNSAAWDLDSFSGVITEPPSVHNRGARPTRKSAQQVSQIWESVSGNDSFNPPAHSLSMPHTSHGSRHQPQECKSLKISKSSLPAESKPGQNHQRSHQARPRARTEIPEDKNVFAETSARNYSVRNRYLTKNEEFLSATKRYQEHYHNQLQQRHFSLYQFQSQNGMKDRSKSGRRNFIQENIIKAKLVKKMKDERTPKPKSLPPMTNKYENMLQNLVASRSISAERSRARSNNRKGEEKKKVATPTAGRRKKARDLQDSMPRSVASSHRSRSSTPRSDGSRSVQLRTPLRPPVRGSAHKVRSQVQSQSQSQWNRQSKPDRVAQPKSVASATSTKSTVNPVTTEMTRKSRSKTKRETHIAKEFKKGELRKNGKVKYQSDSMFYDGVIQKSASATMFSCPDEQKLFMDMVKAEMHSMMRKHMKSTVRKLKVEPKVTLERVSDDEGKKKGRRMDKLVREKVEKWINPEGSLPGMLSTDEENLQELKGNGLKKEKVQLVRFNMPVYQSQY